MFSEKENLFERIKNYQGGEDDAGTCLKSRVEKPRRCLMPNPVEECLCAMLSGATSGIWRGPL